MATGGSKKRKAQETQQRVALEKQNEVATQTANDKIIADATLEREKKRKSSGQTQTRIAGAASLLGETNTAKKSILG